MTLNSPSELSVRSLANYSADGPQGLLWWWRRLGLCTHLAAVHPESSRLLFLTVLPPPWTGINVSELSSRSSSIT